MVIMFGLVSCGGGSSSKKADPVDDGNNNLVNKYSEVKIECLPDRAWVSLEAATKTLQCEPWAKDTAEGEFYQLKKVGFYWSSSDSSIINVGINGLVTAVSTGKANVILKVDDFDGEILKEILVKETQENIRPVAIAGDDQTVTGGDTVNLSGESSTDVDGEVTAWKWEVTEGDISNDDITDINLANASFVAPDSKYEQTIRIKLTVTDSSGDTAEDTIEITVNPSLSNTPPVVTAGDNYEIFEEQPAALVGSFIDDDSKAKSCIWSVSLSAESPIEEREEIHNIENCNNEDLSGLLYQTPSVEENTTYYVTLTITDLQDEVVEKTVEITVKPKPVQNNQPIITSLQVMLQDGNADNSVTGNEGQTVCLTASVTDDFDTEFNYLWEQTDRTSVSVSLPDTTTKNWCYELNSVTTQITQQIRLIAQEKNSEEKLFSDPKTVEVTITPIPEIISVTPTNGASTQNVRVGIKVSFSDEMNCSSMEGALSVSKEEGGNVAGSSNCESKAITFTPASNLEHSKKYLINVSNQAKNIFGNVITNPVEGSYFTTESKLEVNISAGENGSVSSNKILVNRGEKGEFTVTPNEGYSIESVSGCGTKLENDKYITQAMESNCTINVSFIINSYKVTSISGEGGDITPEERDVDYNSEGIFTVTPSEGYLINNVTGCDGQLEGTTFTTGKIKAGCEVTASFIKEHTITVNDTVNGTVAPTSDKIKDGESASFEVSANQGYKIKSVTGCGGYLSGNTYQIDSVNNDCDITTLFELDSYNVKGTVSGLTSGGSVKLQLQYDGNNEYTISSNGEYSLSKKVLHTNEYTLSIVGLPAIDGVTRQNCRINDSSRINEYEIESSINASDDIVNIVCNDLSKLNDTGITHCNDGTENQHLCPQESAPMQDAELGRDSLAMLEKKGGGKAGFDLSRLDSNGNPTTNTSNTECIRDNNTGLIWEAKVSSSGQLRSKGNRYTWYNPDSNTNGGNEGWPNDGNCDGSDCDTYAYIQAINAQGLCDMSQGWRLPTSGELLSIVHNDNQIEDSAHIPDYFMSVDSINAWYWTSNTHAVSENMVRTVSFYNGETNRNVKDYQYYVRLVNDGNQPQAGYDAEITCSNSRDNTLATTITDSFTLNSGTAKDSKTGLTWMRCSLGQEWNESSKTCLGEANGYSWREALQIVTEINSGASNADNNGAVGFAGYADWRLPNKNELASIVEERCYNPSINEELFPSTASGKYWSSSPLTGASGVSQWYIDFEYGQTDTTYWDNNFSVRLVRGGK